MIAHAGHPVAKLVPFRRELEVYPGVTRLSVYVEDDVATATPTRSSPEAST